MMGLDICAKCNRDNSKRDAFGMIQCNLCNDWYHGKCVTSEKAIFTEWAKKDFWICSSCIHKSNIILDTKKVVKQSVTKILSNNSDSKLKAIKDHESHDIDLIIENVINKIWPSISEIIDGSVRDAIAPYKSMIDTLSVRISSLEDHLAKNENYSRRQNIVLQGIPNDINLNNYEFMKKIAQVIGLINFDTNSINKCFRVKKNKNRNSNNTSNSQDSSLSPSAVVIGFLKIQDKNEFLFKYLEKIRHGNLMLNILNSSYPRTPIYVNEHLSSETSKNFYTARMMKKSGLVAKVGIRNGFVFVKEKINDPHTIFKNEDEILKLKLQLESRIINNTQVNLQSNMDE